MITKKISITLKVWRQKNNKEKGAFEIYQANDIDTNMSILEMFDVVNEQLTKDGKEPIAFDHDCREGICGMCGAVVNGQPHGPNSGTTAPSKISTNFSSVYFGTSNCFAFTV